MSETYQLSIGSASHGSLRTTDLLWACCAIMNDIVDKNAVDPPRDYQSFKAVLDTSRYWAKLSAVEHGETEDAADALAQAMDIIQEYCPPYTYFGMHEGDGQISDVGSIMRHWKTANASGLSFQ